ncbi:MAG: hypothetical protein LYZ69_05775 [Nitrososphaerales archaeon]|nr:hypothetical protein [Nitrososphaerales archaeon]
MRRRARKELLAAARGRRTINYGMLMKRFRLSRGRVLSELIGSVDRKEYESGAPGFAAIIVRKDTGYPGGGYFCDGDLPPRLRRPKGRSADPRLSSNERAHIRTQRERIWTYYCAKRGRRVSKWTLSAHPLSTRPSSPECTPASCLSSEATL